MRRIYRDHLFTNRLNLVRRGTRYFYIYHEKDENPIRALRTPELDAAFRAEDWAVFVEAEVKALHGEAIS
jgi:hypothetical protein